MTKEYIEISCDYVRQTPGAVLVNDGTRDIWIPKSQIEDESVFDRLTDLKSSCEIGVTRWFAEKSGLV